MGKNNLGKPDITIGNLDSHLDIDEDSLKIIGVAKNPFIRLWRLISNPFCYIFNGYVRY